MKTDKSKRIIGGYENVLIVLMILQIGVITAFYLLMYSGSIASSMISSGKTDKAISMIKKYEIKNNDAISKKITSQADKLVEQYINESIDYEEASDGIHRFDDISSLGYGTEEQADTIEEVKASRDCVAEASDIVGSADSRGKDFGRAVNLYGKISPADTAYYGRMSSFRDSAVDAFESKVLSGLSYNDFISECKAFMLECNDPECDERVNKLLSRNDEAKKTNITNEIKALEDKEKYEEALELIESTRNTYKNDNAFLYELDEPRKRVVEELIDQKRENKYYSDAVDLADKYMEEFKTNVFSDTLDTKKGDIIADWLDHQVAQHSFKSTNGVFDLIKEYDSKYSSKKLKKTGCKGFADYISDLLKANSYSTAKSAIMDCEDEINTYSDAIGFTYMEELAKLYSSWSSYQADRGYYLINENGESLSALSYAKTANSYKSGSVDINKIYSDCAESIVDGTISHIFEQRENNGAPKFSYYYENNTFAQKLAEYYRDGKTPPSDDAFWNLAESCGVDAQSCKWWHNSSGYKSYENYISIFDADDEKILYRDSTYTQIGIGTAIDPDSVVLTVFY